MTTAHAATLPAELLDLVVACTVAAVVAELAERGNPGGDSTDQTIDPSADAGFDGEGFGRPV
jgi:hypothetical protein